MSEIPQGIKEQLTKRDIAHLELLSFGCTMKEIAEEFRMTGATTEGVRTRLFAKMRAKNAAEAVRIGFETGILKPRG